MFFEHREFRLSKDVRRPEEYEDASAADPLRGVAAVADGVSSSLFSRAWAKLLVEAAVKDPPNIQDEGRLADWLARLRTAWSDPIDADSLAWHQKPKLQKGASATLLVMQLFPQSREDAETSVAFRLTAHATGDCCLFHVRGEQVLRAFPYEDSRLFQNDPRVITSVDRKGHRSIQFDTLEDECQPDDLIVLCTDAIGAWALAQLEAGHSPNWHHCWDLSERDWREHIHRLREDRLIRFDDTTVLLLKVGRQPPTLSEERNLRGDWREDAKKGLDDFARQGKNAIKDLKEQGKKALDWFKSGGRKRDGEQ
jgi:serine/threonine protein phosphatase PrpC